MVIVTVLELELPALMLPNARLDGFAVRPADAATPVPLRATTVGEFGALLVMLTLPERLPAVVGANKTLNVAVPPAASVAGVVRPLTVNPLPLAAIWEIVREAVPVLVMVKDCELV